MSHLFLKMTSYGFDKPKLYLDRILIQLAIKRWLWIYAIYHVSQDSYIPGHLILKNIPEKMYGEVNWLW